MTWKVVAITDTHNRHEDLTLPDGDILIHAGDATNKGTHTELLAFFEWFGNQPHAHKIFVAGNHDFRFIDDAGFTEALCRDNGITYLRDAFVVLEAEGKANIKIYGAPVHPNFTIDEKDIQDLTLEIPEEVDILVTHVPPYGIFDEVCDDFKIKYLGNYQLLGAIQLRKPKYHVFGHVHEGYGTKRLADTTFINACNCDRRGKIVNNPVVFEV